MRGEVAPAPSGGVPLSNEEGRNTCIEQEKGLFVPIHKQVGIAYLLQYNHVLSKGGNTRANYVEATETVE